MGELEENVAGKVERARRWKCGKKLVGSRNLKVVRVRGGRGEVCIIPFQLD